MKTIETTVIVRTMNNEDIISKTLKALFSQTYKDFKLLVVDSGSHDDTLKKVSFYQHNLMQVEQEDYHPGIVLNNAIKQTNTELIVFLNSDTVMLHKNCLQLLIDGLKEKENSAVYARQIARPEAKPWVRRDYEISFPKTAENPSWMFYSLPLSGIKKSVWEENPFYTKSWASEDTQMGVDLVNKNLKVKYLSNIIVMHSHNYTLNQIYNRRFVEGEADAFIFSSKFNILHMIKSYLSSIFNDIKYHLKVCEFYELGFCFIRRFVYQYAYYKGHKNGEKRKKLNTKTTFGNYQ